MSAGRSPAPVLVVARSAQARKRLREQLGESRPVIDAAPDALARTPGVYDAPAAFAVLEGDDPADLEELDPLLELPGGRNLCLVARDVSDERLAEALARTAPRRMLVHPTTPVALRYVLDQLDPDASGRGARHQHRSARSLLGVSAAIRDVMAQIRQVAPTDVAVLILGETGTGKELVARSVHEQSTRRPHDFMAINCAAIPEHLLEAELFGFGRGAFTGADREKQGLAQAAHGGTLFLDEVAELPGALQAKLLRLLEQGEVRPLGSTETTTVDVRIVSATHQDLGARVEENRFRRDLFYRLNTVTLTIPPLRRRKVDIPFLAQHFAEEFGALHARRISLGEDFLERLTDHDFPGNVRELRNAVERAIALAKPGDELAEEDLPADLRRMPRLLAVGSLRDRIMQVELQAIRDALERFGGNRTRTAEALGISRLGLRQKMRRLGIEEPSGD